MLPLTLKKLSKVEIFRLILNIHQILKRCPPKYKKLAKTCAKNVFYGLLFVLFGRFDDSRGRAGLRSVSGKLQDKPGELV